MSETSNCWRCGKPCTVVYNPKPHHFCADHGGKDA